MTTRGSSERKVHSSPKSVTSSPIASPKPSVKKVDKGKGRADIPPPSLTPLSAALDEALHEELPRSSLEEPGRSSLPSSIDTTPTPISPPPKAHYAPDIHHLHPPKLLSQLTRTTLPTASLSYASAELPAPKPRAASWGEGQSAGSSKQGLYGWRYTGQPNDCDIFPDLDPTTGLPIGIRRDSSSSDSPSLHLQRTITGLSAQQQSGSRSSLLPSLPALPNLPAMPSLSSFPALPSLPWQQNNRSSMDLTRSDSRRSFSSSSAQEDWGSWTGWWGNKSKVDRMMSEEDQADTVEEERENLRRKYRTPKNPLVFCHGLLGFDFVGPASLPSLQISHWRGIREVLESNGVDVLITRVAATASIKDRAQTLVDAITEKYPGQEVNLIAHSMGGLDCRYLISELKPTGFKPVSLTTISTPHRGSPFADYLIDNVVGRERLPTLLSALEALKLPQSGDGSAFSALGTRSMKEFNSEIVNMPDVKYYSWGASFDPGLLDTFKWPHSVIQAKEGPNDGLVSVHSARWGEYRGTLLGVNHLDLVGWVNHVRYAFAGWAGTPIAFKPATFYLEVSDYLAEQGF